MFYTNVCLRGNSVLYRGFENGKRIRKTIKYRPTYYVQTNKPSDYKGLNGETLGAMNFDDIYSAREFYKQYEQVENFKVYGLDRFEITYIADVFKNDIKWDVGKIRIGYIDIEVASDDGFPNIDLATKEITAITYYVDGKYYVFGCGDFVTSDPDVVYLKCKDEVSLIVGFLNAWCIDYPDIITGWSITQFDIPYLVNRIRVLFQDEPHDVALRLSPWNIINEREVEMLKRKRIFYQLGGIGILDYIDLYRKFSSSGSQESYALNYIAKVELEAEKLDYSEYGTLTELYRRNYQKFIEYNIKDVELVYRLENKLKLIELAMTLAYNSKTNYEDVFHQTRMWDSLIYNHLKKKNIIIPPRNKTHKAESYIGAYVKPTIVGKHKWVVSFDLTSLYPMLIQQYNISPEVMIKQTDDLYNQLKILLNKSDKVSIETLIDHKPDLKFLKDYNVTMTPNKQFFRRDKQGFMPELMAKMFQERSQFKKEMMHAEKQLEIAKPEDKKDIVMAISKFNNLQATIKICLNSLYGVMGNAYFRFFDVRIAEAVTLSAQLSIKYIGSKLNALLNRMAGTTNIDFIIASDTDSVYLNLEAIVDKMRGDETDIKKVIKMMDRLCKEVISPYIDKSFGQLADYMNAYENKMSMKREALADVGIWTAKKNYFLNVWDKEGVEYAEPKLKITGLQAIRTTVPEVSRKAIKKAFKLVIEGDHKKLIQFSDNFRKEFFELNPHDIASPRGVNDLVKWESDGGEIYKKSTPIHVKGSLLHNRLIDRLDLGKKYEKIREGDKIRFIYLKEPNPTGVNVISFIHDIPPEFDILNYLDYNMQFEKTYVGSLEGVLNAVGWDLENRTSIEDLFEY